MLYTTVYKRIHTLWQILGLMTSEKNNSYNSPLSMRLRYPNFDLYRFYYTYIHIVACSCFIQQYIKGYIPYGKYLVWWHRKKITVTILPWACVFAIQTLIYIGSIYIYTYSCLLFINRKYSNSTQCLEKLKIGKPQDLMKFPQKYGRSENSTTYCSDTVMQFIIKIR